MVALSALFFVRGSQLRRSRSPHATRIDANKSATKVVRQIMLASLGSLRFLLVSMLLESRATLGGMSPTLFYRLARLLTLPNH
jgi:hypothetical protein